MLNAASFVAVLASLACLRTAELHPSRKAPRTRGSLADGFRYIWRRSDLKTILVILFLVGTFGLNFPIFISTMSVGVFHTGASKFGLLMSMMAIGSISGALLAARREQPRITLLFAAGATFGVGCTLAALMPNSILFGLALAIIGVSAQTLTTSANSLVQLSTDPLMRGRVIAILFAITMGGTPIGAPIVGWVADRFGPRWGLGVGAASGFAAAAVGIYYLVTYRHLRIGFAGGRVRVSLDAAAPKPAVPPQPDLPVIEP